MADPFEIYKPLFEAESLDHLASLIQKDALHYFRAFYGCTDSVSGDAGFLVEEAFQELLRRPAGDEIQLAAGRLPGAVDALLLLFASFFERKGMYGSLLHIANLLPGAPWGRRVKALYIIASASDVRDYYLNNLDEILRRLKLFKSVRAKDLDILIFCKFILDAGRKLLARGCDRLYGQFLDAVRERLSNLSAGRKIDGRLGAVLSLSFGKIGRELVRVSSSIAP